MAHGVDTAIGCIPTDDLSQLFAFFLRFAYGISGGIIFLMMIRVGYMVLTSTGNPEKLQAAKEDIVSLFSGLILIVFSVILLQTVGVSILQLPTF